ncbi:MAG TPA: hypothetical protein VID48_11425 [Solirubrobacteraceae bacterium]
MVLAPSLTALLVTLAGGCGQRAGVSREYRESPPASVPQPPPPVKGPTGGLALGLTEDNPNLLVPAGQPVNGAFAAAEGLLNDLAPEYLRIDIDWATLEPTSASVPLLQGPVSGCARQFGPCASYAGLDTLLRTIAARQRASAAAGSSPAGGGPQVVVVFYNAPAWATLPPSGCEAAETGAGARLINPAGLRAYRQLIDDVLVLERRDGARLRWWSAWDEPNQPVFLAPQRARCERSSPTLAPAVYATLARNMLDVLAGASGGPHQLVLGDLAGIPEPSPHATSIGEFVDGMPADLLCSSAVWAIHVYPTLARTGVFLPGSNENVVEQLERSLRARGGCAARARIWVTETGVGNPHSGGQRALSPTVLKAQCRLLAQALLGWYQNPKVDVVLQYTFREDPLFQVGLLSADLSRIYPTYYLLKAWEGGRPPSAPAPLTAPQCQ